MSPRDVRPTIELEIDGMIVRGNGREGIDFVKGFSQIVRDRKEAQAVWVDGLRARGIKAAHADDGWVDRERDTVQFVYPDFYACPKVGDLVALGNFEKYRVVEVTEHLPPRWVDCGRDPRIFRFVDTGEHYG